MTKETITPQYIRELLERKQAIKLTIKEIEATFEGKGLVSTLGRGARGVAMGKSLTAAFGLPDNTVNMIKEFMDIDETLDTVMRSMVGVAHEVQP